MTETNSVMPQADGGRYGLQPWNLLMAVLEKRRRYEMSRLDAYVNIAGGMKMNEPALDLAIIMALMSSYKDRPVDPKNAHIRGRWACQGRSGRIPGQPACE